MRRLPTPSAALFGIALFGASCIAQAGDLVASASQNLFGQVNNSTLGSSVTAAWPDAITPIAQSWTTRTSIAASTTGAGFSMPVHQAAGGGARTDYILWDLGTNLPLDFGVASTLTLSFNFRVSGLTEIPAVSLSTVGVNFDATLFSEIVDVHANSVSAVFGPVPPFPSEGYLINGDAGLISAYDFGFSLLHQNRVSGLWTMGLGTSASNASNSTARMWLESISVLSGTPPVGGLAVRLETDELLAVAVPEVPVWLLMLAGGAWVMGFGGRRKA